MINLEDITRQHKAIIDEINLINKEVDKGKSAMDSASAALHISKLAGVIKIHLLHEDRFIYPELKKNPDYQSIAVQYDEEMGDLAEKYIDFKTKYNTKKKIDNNPELFLTEAKSVINSLNKRITKEDQELYRIILEKGL